MRFRFSCVPHSYLLFGLLFGTFLLTAARADDLPRKVRTSRESYPNVDVIYDSVSYVNKNGDLATFYEIPNTGHTFQHYLTLADAFKGKSAPFDPKVIGLLTDWLRNKAITHED
jgi:hypothetical protein